jgi:hypothetical protein
VSPGTVNSGSKCSGELEDLSPLRGQGIRNSGSREEFAVVSLGIVNSGRRMELEVVSPIRGGCETY